MIKVFSGYMASRDSVGHQALMPCVKLVCGRKVVSLVGHATGFSKPEGEAFLRVAHMDSRYMRCFVMPDQETAQDPRHLWDPKLLSLHEIGQDSIKTIELAMKWLMEPPCSDPSCEDCAPQKCS